MNDASLIISFLFSLANGTGVFRVAQYLFEHITSWVDCTPLQKRLIVAALSAALPLLAYAILLWHGDVGVDKDSILTLIASVLLSYFQSQMAHGWVKTKVLAV